jgi:hypothetical protein
MSKKKIAVINTGHARMVPYGWQLIWERAAHIPSCDFTVYSYVWDAGSDNRNTMQIFHHPWQFPGLDQQVFQQLGDRHCLVEQRPIMDRLYRQYLAEEAIPKAWGAEDEIKLPRELFDRFNGQLLGFLLAMERWRHELQYYDYIIRARWDMTLDVGVLSELISQQESPARLAPLFYTKYLDFTHGCYQISGDTIYGEAQAFIDIFGDFSACIQRLISGVRRRYQWIQRNQRAEWVNTDPLKKYFLEGWWFNTHFLWTTLFEDHGVIIKSRGESFAIHPSCSEIPLEQFEFGHAMIGPEYNRDRRQLIADTSLAAHMQPFAHTNPPTLPEPKYYPHNKVNNSKAKLDRIARLQQRIDQHRNKG